MADAMRRPSKAVAAAKFVAKTSAQDAAKVTADGVARINKYLQRRGLK